MIAGRVPLGFGRRRLANRPAAPEAVGCEQGSVSRFNRLSNGHEGRKGANPTSGRPELRHHTRLTSWGPRIPGAALFTVQRYLPEVVTVRRALQHARLASAHASPASSHSPKLARVCAQLAGYASRRRSRREIARSGPAHGGQMRERGA